MNSPTALNKRGKKIHKWGQDWDSQKELDFYERFLMKQVKPDNLLIHHSYPLCDLYQVTNDPVMGPIKIRSWKYTPDFVVLDDFKHFLHVYDVKNSLGVYGLSEANKLTFKMFARKYGIPVEGVVVRAHDFKVAAIGVSKQLDLDWTAKKAAKRAKENKKPTVPPRVKSDVWYNWKEATNY
ncbi:DUF1064 domain-containing protein [Furfurilactobacillus rossiae]|nr:DUF1064 domain-containing protein [Furfurilactobacillus rossiae]QFR66446.1 DUF1064 domain-containing protein [Furfurilactobacillus rossiae]QLE61902.1 hypothetical protein LROSRS0_1857 [Furfurilactobacillus rossiae]